MTDTPIRTAFVGCGRVAQHYIKILTDQPVASLHVVGACDLEQAKAAQMAAVFGAECFTDYAAMLEKTAPDLVIILTPSGEHYHHAFMALEAGCHVLTEKPVTLVPEEAEELTALAAQKGLMFGTAFQNRFNPAVRKLRETLDSGRLGKRVTAAIRLRWCRYQEYYEDGWHGSWAQDGGVINQQAVHHVDALNWLCGPVEAVCALGAKRLNELEAEDTLVAALQFADGSLGTIEATTAARPEDFEASLSVVGEKGMVQIGGVALNNIDIWRFVDPLPGDETVADEYSQDVPSGYGLSHGPLLAETAARLSSGSIEAPIPGAEAVKAVALVHALYASIEQGGWMKLADRPRSKLLGVNSGHKED